jgi:hypoxanthine phosphoribosyltransferase
MKTPALPMIERVLLTREQIDERLKEVAAEISVRYRNGNLKLIGVLKGSVFFLAALARELTIPVKVDFLAISSFSDHGGAPGVVRIAKDLDESIEGEDVLLVEDIVNRVRTAPHCAFASGFPLFRDTGPLRHRLRTRLQAALSQP